MNTNTFQVRFKENGKNYYFFKFSCQRCNYNIGRNITHKDTPHEIKCDKCGKHYKALGFIGYNVEIEIVSEPQKMGYTELITSNFLGVQDAYTPEEIVVRVEESLSNFD